MSPNALFQAARWRKKGSVVLVTLFVLFTIVLAACGGGSGSTTTTPSGQTNAKNSVLTAVSGPKGDWTRNFNPISPTVLDGAKGFIYETLLFFNRQKGDITPWLAESYKFTEDSKSVTFNLRKNVTWTDGKPFTSDDVVFTLELMKKFPGADGSALWSYISDVAAPDANTVTVNFKEAYTPVLWFLGGQTFILPKHLWSEVTDPVKFTNENPVGTGPYTLKAFTPQLITLGKNNSYWQPGKPEVTEIRWPSFNANTGAELLLTRGELDWAGLFTPDIKKTFVSRDPEKNHYWFPAGNVVMLYLNLTKAPFDNLAVRQAISAVLDRQQIFEVAESGYAPVSHPTALVLPANQQHMNPEYASAAYSIDTAKAAQLLEGAGYTKGADGIYAGPDGKKLEFKLNVVTGWTDWVTTCQIIAKNLKDLGINVTVNSISFNAYISALEMGDFEMSISWTNGGPSPFFLYNALLNSKYTNDVGKRAPSNWQRWKDENTDKLLAQYSGTTDEAAQQQALHGLQKVMVEQLPSIPLFYGPIWYEYSTARFTGWPDENNAYAEPAPWSTPDSAVVALNLKPVP